ncbi:MAG TPA: FAD-dependent oxidoreductase [Jatrophihabitantaceae bacterium]|nr:FAD-dependent oxidoreductase [Jatrophihabitantaceae bacterium]HYU40174.1 FAD-dependent oxidoreductase [Acidimicrobiia bacterium]
MDADVCVVGAGYAGLAAARRVVQAGGTVVVLEARDRVAGRVWTRRAPDGTPIDAGGTWLGPGQDAAYKLAAEMGVRTYPTWAEGQNVFAGSRGVKRFGNVPPINPIALASLALGMARLDRMAKRVLLDEPWSGPRAAAWDARSAGQWIGAAGNVPAHEARALLGAAVRGLFTCDPSEVSLLHVLYLIRSANGFNRLLTIEGGYQQERVTGGAQTIADRVAAELGDAVHLGTAVRSISQDAGGVVVRGDGAEVQARRAIVTIPPALSEAVSYEPQLPADRALLVHSMPAGSVLKISVMYDEPFWRADGLNGQSIATASPIEMTLDASPSSGMPGVLAAFGFGPHARTLGALDAEERRRVVLATLVDRFGPRAAQPVHYEELDWAEERWSRGCYMAHMPPGVLTRFGRALRAPVGRIHWAGTETATVSHGTIDGAIRSGDRAAAEVLAAE